MRNCIVVSVFSYGRDMKIADYVQKHPEESCYFRGGFHGCSPKMLKKLTEIDIKCKSRGDEDFIESIVEKYKSCYKKYLIVDSYYPLLNDLLKRGVAFVNIIPDSADSQDEENKKAERYYMNKLRYTHMPIFKSKGSLEDVLSKKSFFKIANRHIVDKEVSYGIPNLHTMRYFMQ